VLHHPAAVEPDRDDPSLQRRWAPIDAFCGRVLSAVINVRAQPPRIVTAFFDRRKARP